MQQSPNQKTILCPNLPSHLDIILFPHLLLQRACLPRSLRPALGNLYPFRSHDDWGQQFCRGTPTLPRHAGASAFLRHVGACAFLRHAGASAFLQHVGACAFLRHAARRASKSTMSDCLFHRFGVGLTATPFHLFEPAFLRHATRRASKSAMSDCLFHSFGMELTATPFHLFEPSSHSSTAIPKSVNARLSTRQYARVCRADGVAVGDAGLRSGYRVTSVQAPCAWCQPRRIGCWVGYVDGGSSARVAQAMNPWVSRRQNAWVCR